jgi:hypothetical protein
VTGFNANGIAQTPNRRAVLVINSTTGVLFRVNPQSGRATRVDLGGTSLTAGDGLLVRGRAFYVVRNQLEQVAVIKLNARDQWCAVKVTSHHFDGRLRSLRSATASICPTPDSTPRQLQTFVLDHTSTAADSPTGLNGSLMAASFSELLFANRRRVCCWLVCSDAAS